MINYELYFLISLLAVVYCYILTRPRMILNWLYNWLWAVFKNDERTNGGHWIFKIIIGCEKCLAGQISLWLFLYLNYQQYLYAPLETAMAHILSVVFSIFCAATLLGVYTKYIEQ